MVKTLDLLHLVCHALDDLLLTLLQLHHLLLVFEVQLLLGLLHLEVVSLPFLQPHIHNLELAHSLQLSVQLLSIPFVELIAIANLSFLPLLRQLEKAVADGILLERILDVFEFQLKAFDCGRVIGLLLGIAVTQLPGLAWQLLLDDALQQCRLLIAGNPEK